MKLTGTPAKRPMKIVTDENGKTRAVIDTAAQEAKLDIPTRLKRRNSQKVRISRNPRQTAG